jgi:hypothetical protein
MRAGAAAPVASQHDGRSVLKWMDQLAAPEPLEPTRSQSCTYCFVVQQTLDEEAEAVLEAEADWEAVDVCAGCLQQSTASEISWQLAMKLKQVLRRAGAAASTAVAFVKDSQPSVAANCWASGTLRSRSSWEALKSPPVLE